MKGEPKDERSTYRRRGRKALFDAGVPFVCGGNSNTDEFNCGRSPTVLPNDAPKDLKLAPIEKQVEGLVLQVNHINKNIADNDLVNLEWLCPSDHAKKDRQTEKGVSVTGGNEQGYDLSGL